MTDLCVTCSSSHHIHYWVGACGPFCVDCWESRLKRAADNPKMSLESRVEELEAQLLKIKRQLFQDP